MAERQARGNAGSKGEKAGAPSFEEALAGLEQSVEAMKGEGTTLEGVIKSFEEGMAYYNRCEAILNEAKQRIEVCDKKGF
jgi:exodeoxyribonuclease VII small subunit